MKTFKITTSIFITVFLCAFTTSNPFDEIFSFLEKYNNEFTPDKVFVHTDKLSYNSEDTLWYKVYLADGITHLPDSRSKIVYTELINPKKQILQTNRHFLDKIGSAGEFILDKEYPAGNYTLRAYTQYMRNEDKAYFFQQEFNLYNNQKLEMLSIEGLPSTEILEVNDESFDIQFFPEGGDFIDGTINNLGVKLTDNNGNGIICEGVIEDTEGNILCPFKTYEFGLGSVKLTPEKGQKLFAKLIVNGKTYTRPLPLAQKEGYAFIIENKPQFTLISVNTNEYNSLKGCRVIAHIRGSVFLDNDIDTDLDSYSIKIDKSELPSGVAHVNLFRPDGEPVAERLFFINNIKQQCELSTDKTQYNKREAIELGVATTEGMFTDQEYVDLSLTVFSNDNKSISPEVNNIQTWLLLNSDLRGEIENPSYFFEKPGDYKRSYLLDLLLLTHGWRRFVWKDLKQLNSDYIHEDGLYIKGHTANLLNKKKRIPAKVILNFLNDTFLEEEEETDIEGQFSFGPFISFDTVQAFIQARRLKKDRKLEKLEGNRNVYIDLDIETTSPKLDNIRGGDIVLRKDSILAFRNFLNNSQQTSILRDQLNMMEVELEELVITSKRKQIADEYDQIQKNNSIYGEPSNRLIIDENDHLGVFSVFDLMRRIPGVNVRGNPPNQSATIRGPVSLNASVAPQYVVNGIRVDEEYINWINPIEVLFIDVLKGAQASIFGINGAGGVIVVYTGAKKALVKGRKPGIVDFDLAGFYKAREFYSENHSIDKAAYAPDYRSTLYWNPLVLLDNQTKHTETFYASDIPGKYLIQLQGLKSNGELVYEEKIIEVN